MIELMGVISHQSSSPDFVRESERFHSTIAATAGASGRSSLYEDGSTWGERVSLL
ncbi:hypothetical protein OIU77_012568, partial [Salix suchowensis]